MNEPYPILPPKFKGLVTKIYKGECVLVLGPRIMVPKEITGGQSIPIDDFLTDKLLEDLGAEGHGGGGRDPSGLRGAIARYEKERNPAECRSFVQDRVTEFDPYSTELHRDLASLPFRLVLSATPDTMMINAFRSQGKLSVQEAWYDYCKRISAETALTAPSCDRPIVYSLFGRYDRPESMVLNDKNLLDYLVSITKESPPLPDAVRATLRAASTVFLFVGFGFTNWWLRLLLKVLEITGVDNRSLSLALEDGNSADNAASGENRGFFESVGINIVNIQTGGWNELAKALAARFREQDAARTPVTKSQVIVSDSVQGRPKVFLSYASEDADTVESLRMGLEDRGVNVWLDKQNLRLGDYWEAQITRIIKEIDYFIFVQTENMDQRDQKGEDGVYNGELKRALKRIENKPYAAVFVIHVTIGSCRLRPEPELAQIHRIAIDADTGADKIAAHLLESYNAARGGAISQVA
jgi:hypothetical protein